MVRSPPLGGARLPAILGISAFYHDSAAALVIDGRIVAAAQEERFTRKKHDSSFPEHAVAYCLREGRISADELDYVAMPANVVKDVEQTWSAEIKDNGGKPLVATN